MKRFVLLIGLVGLFIGGSASADWLKSCIGTNSLLCTAVDVPWDCCTGAGTGPDCDSAQASGMFISALNGTGRLVCHRYNGQLAADCTAASIPWTCCTGNGAGATCHNQDPSVLQITDCDQVDIMYYPDFDGDATDSAGTVDVYTCPSIGRAHLNTEAELEAACQPLDGGTTLDAANTEVEGLGASWVWFDVEGWVDDNELQVKCNVGPE